MSEGGGWAAGVERTLRAAFAQAQSQLAPVGLSLDLLEVSWIEQRPLPLPFPLPPQGAWRSTLNWLLRRWPARQDVRVSVRLTAEGAACSASPL